MKSVKELAQLEGRVYVYFSSNDLCKRFLADAESEGLTFCDGIKPTQKQPASIIALNRNCTLNYVGTNGRIAFGSGVKRLGDENLIMVDYGRYITEESYDPNQPLSHD